MKRFFKQKIMIRMISSVSAMILLLGSSFPSMADEGKVYTVTLRAGIYGDFNQTGAEDKKWVIRVGEGQVFDLNHMSTDIVTVQHQYENDYFVKPVSIDGTLFNGDRVINRNEEYVIEYGRLVDAVEYTIEYVDNANGAQIAEPQLNHANHGETITAKAKTISNYELVGESTRSFDLDKTATSNKITFRYNSTLTGGTNTNTTYQTIDGGVETINETQQNPIFQTAEAVAPVAAQAATGGQGADDTTTIEDEGAALDDTPADTTTDQGTGSGEDGADKTTIEEEEIPLALGMDQPVNIAALIAVMLGGVALILAFVWIAARRRIAVIEGQDDDHDIDEDL